MRAPLLGLAKSIYHNWPMRPQVENLVKIFYDHERSWMILSRSLSWKDLAKILAS